MAGRYQGYHQGFEMTMAHQAALRAAAVQDRCARQARDARGVGWHSRLMAQLQERRQRWGTRRTGAAAGMEMEWR